MKLFAALILMSATVSSGEPDDYTTAYKKAMKGDKPLVVLVTAEWCPPCQNLKRNTLPQLIDRKSLSQVHFAMVDLDRDSKIARQLIGPRPVPHFVMFEKKDGKWKKKYLEGYQTVASVENFLETQALRTAKQDIEKASTAKK